MFKNLHELVTQMKDEQACIDYLAAQRWQDGKAVCVYCGNDKCYRIEGGKRFKCANKNCYKRFHVTVGTIFHASNIPLTKWFMGMYIASAHKKGISSYQLAKDLGITQKSAWFMLHRLRQAFKEKQQSILTGIVELDETYMSRKYGSEYKAITPDISEKMDYMPKKRDNKGAVIGLAERNGNVIIKAADRITAESIGNAVKENVAPDTHLMTDESYRYKKVLADYKRDSVNHSAKQWVYNKIVHTNTVENFWSVMKRGVYGIYHQISYKHLQAYCNEFSYRYNNRKMSDATRFILTLSKVEGKLPYKTLIQNGKSSEEKRQTQA